MSQARMKLEIFVNFWPDPDPKSSARLTTKFLNVKNLILSNYSKNARNVINGIKIVIFSKNCEKLSSGWGLRPHTPVCDTFELH